MTEKIERIELECMCERTRDHLTSFIFLPDDPDSVIVGSSLNHYLPIWKRLIIGVKFILGIDNTYCQYTEALVDKKEMLRLKIWVDSVTDRMQ